MGTPRSKHATSCKTPTKKTAWGIKAWFGVEQRPSRLSIYLNAKPTN